MPLPAASISRLTRRKAGPFADVRVRQAVDMALNRQEILDKAAKGIGSVPETYMTPVFDWAMSETARE